MRPVQTDNIQSQAPASIQKNSSRQNRKPATTVSNDQAVNAEIPSEDSVHISLPQPVAVDSPKSKKLVTLVTKAEKDLLFKLMQAKRISG